MFTKISVLVPTRKRLDRLRTLLASYEGTTRDAPALSELVFRVDNDDLETQDMLLALSPCCVVVGPRLDGYLSMPQFFNEMAVAATGDVMMCGNDDMVFRTPGWARHLLDVANRYPDGLFDLGVSTLNEAHYPFTVVSRRAVDALGFLWDPRVFWGDIFWRDVMARLGRTVMVPQVVIDHDWAGFRPDRVFAETRLSKSRVEGDASYWTTVHAPAISEAVERLAPLLRQEVAQ